MDFKENIKEISEKKGKSFVNNYARIYQLMLRLDVVRNCLRNIDKISNITKENIPVELTKEHSELFLKELFILHFYSFTRSLRIDFKELDVEVPNYCADGTLQAVRHKCVAHLSDSGDSEPLKAWEKIAENYSDLLDDYESIKQTFTKNLAEDLIKCGVVLR